MSLGNIENKTKSLLKDTDPSNLDIIKAARDSRNYLCHTSAKEIILENCLDKLAAETEDEIFESLIKHVKNVARGDYVVSRWNEQFHGDMSIADTLHLSRDAYVKEIVRWVLGQVQ
jgi:hypothetical protein